jgi:predicted transcriptional regulator of viral defense system
MEFISKDIIKIDAYRPNIGYNTQKSRLYNWKKRGVISHIRKGVYFPTDIQNKFQIACNSVENGCLSYHAALEYYLLQTQEFNWLYIHSSVPFREFVYQNEKYIYKPLKFIYKPLVDKENPEFPIIVTSLSQTIIDCIYNIGLAGGIEELLYALVEADSSRINESEMLECLRLYDMKSLYQRAGYLLSYFKDILKLSNLFFDVCKRGMGQNVSYLTSPYSCDSFSKEWNICAPKNVMKQMQKDYFYEF